MKFFWNNKKVSKEKLLEKVEDDSTIVNKLTIELPNKNKTDKVTMEGFDISKDLLISMAQKCDEMDAECTITLNKCGALGNKTVVITVK